MIEFTVCTANPVPNGKGCSFNVTCKDWRLVEGTIVFLNEHGHALYIVPIHEVRLIKRKSVD